MAIPQRPLEPPAAMILACGSAHGHRVELLEYQDGTLAIRRDGELQASYPLGVCGLESCITSYMGFLRSCPPADPSKEEAGKSR